jgi:hypothetical protein
MKYLVLIVLVSFLMCTGCIAQPKPATESQPQKLIRTICDKCPCKSIDVDGESVNATCYAPEEKEPAHGINRTNI